MSSRFWSFLKIQYQMRRYKNIYESLLFIRTHDLHCLLKSKVPSFLNFQFHHGKKTSISLFWCWCHNLHSAYSIFFVGIPSSYSEQIEQWKVINHLIVFVIHLSPEYCSHKNLTVYWSFPFTITYLHQTIIC